MRHICSLLGALIALCFALPAHAQLSIDEVSTPKQEVQFREEIKSTQVEVDYFNEARYKAERAAIRKERNYLEIGAKLQGSLTSYNDAWIKVSGGDNSIALVATFNLSHLYNKNLFSLETKLNAKLGYNRMNVELDGGGEKGTWFKNQDEFVIWVNPAWAMAKNFSYGATFQFRSQFANGYVSRTEQEDMHRKSSFMTPGYLDISVGITYQSPSKKFPIKVNFSPLAMSAVYATDELVRTNGHNYGIKDPNKNSKYEGGSSIEVGFDRTFGKSGWLRYRTTLFSFTGWITNLSLKNRYTDVSEFEAAKDAWSANGGDINQKPNLAIHPTVRWDNTIDIKATKFISTTLSFQLYYNRAQSYEVQMRTLLSVGLAYTFKNK